MDEFDKIIYQAQMERECAQLAKQYGVGFPNNQEEYEEYISSQRAAGYNGEITAYKGIAFACRLDIYDEYMAKHEALCREFLERINQ